MNTVALICSSCLQAKASLKSNLHCGICECLLCKECVQFLDESSFSFLKVVPDELKQKIYCTTCYEQKVAPAKGPYLELMERAKHVYVFFKKTNIPLIKRSKTQVSVEDCADREETLLRLADFSAEQSFKALVEVNLTPEKVFINGYRRLSWSGTACPAAIRALSLEENHLKKKEKPQPERIRKNKK